MSFSARLSPLQQAYKATLESTWTTHPGLSFLVPLTQDQEPAAGHGVTPLAVSIELILPHASRFMRVVIPRQFG
jgi:hypothetical protein